MTVKYNNCTYSIVYNGQLYNTDELRDELIENGFEFETYSDTEVLLKSYILWGYDVVKKCLLLVITLELSLFIIL